MGRNNVKTRGTGRKTFAIVVDGETEMWYLQMLHRNEKIKGISIQPELPTKKKLADQFNTVKSNAQIYDLSIWIIDLDVVIKDNKIAELNKYLTEAKSDSKIKILVNTPCLEFWFLNHVKDTGRYYATGDSLIKELIKYDPVKDFAKSEKYFVKDTPDIYKRLRPYLKNAIENAGKRGDFDTKNPLQGKAEMYKLFSLLGLDITE